MLAAADDISVAINAARTSGDKEVHASSTDAGRVGAETEADSSLFDLKEMVSSLITAWPTEERQKG